MRNANGTRLYPIIGTDLYLIIGTDLYAKIVLSVFQFFCQLETIKLGGT